VHYSSWTLRMKGDKLLQRPCDWSVETRLSVQNRKHFPGPLCYLRQSRIHVRQHLPCCQVKLHLASVIIHEYNRPFPDHSTFFCRSPTIWSTYQQLLQVKSCYALYASEGKLLQRLHEKRGSEDGEHFACVTRVGDPANGGSISLVIRRWRRQRERGRRVTD